MQTQKGTVDEREILHFSKDSTHWWDENGPFKPLHRLNPVRMSYIKQQICNHYDLDFQALKPLNGLRILDIGCGGGLVCEPLARMGADITGIDADATAINIARTHSTQSGLTVNYIAGDAENLTDQFDVVLALEVIEHVSDIPAFMKICKERLKPGGLFILSTLNRTPKSYALGIIAAEYILRWVPRGTHTWKKFIKPSEMASYGRHEGLEAIDLCGLIFNPLKNEFVLSKSDLDVNYLIAMRRQP